MSRWTTMGRRFHTDLRGEPISDGFLDFLGAFAARQGLTVRDENVTESPEGSAYRSAAVATRFLVIEVPRELWRTFPAWRSLRIRQEGSNLQLDGSLPPAYPLWPMYLLPLYWLVRIERNTPLALPLLLLILAVPVLRWVASNRRATIAAHKGVAAFLADALREQRVAPIAAPIDPPAESARTSAADRSEARLRVADPAFAATVRAVHADRTDPADREGNASEDLVAERRGGGET